MARTTGKHNGPHANFRLEDKLWAAAGALRNNMDAADWRGELLKDDQRWAYGTPPAGNANYTWVQRFVHHLPPIRFAGFALANGSKSSHQSGEGEIRHEMKAEAA